MIKEYVELRVKKRIQETPEAITLLVEPTDGVPLSYQAGQFLTLLVRIGNKELRRSYSLSSTPGVDPDMAITIKRLTNGEVSRYLIDHTREGDTLHALQPAGRFTLKRDTANQRDIFFIGAGSGITPLFSLLKYALAKELDSQVTLINSNKNEKTALFYNQLEKLAASHPDTFTLHHLFSNPTTHSPVKVPVRLNIGLLQTLINKFLIYNKKEAQFYVCGPPDFMRMVHMTLIFMEISRDHIYQEIFVTEELPDIVSPLAQYSTPRKVVLSYRFKNYTLEVPYNKSILKMALEKGIPLPYSCMGGVCSTCVALCKSGSVHMTINKVLTDREVAAGLILTCVSYPLTDTVVIEVK